MVLEGNRLRDEPAGSGLRRADAAAAADDDDDEQRRSGFTSSRLEST